MFLMIYINKNIQKAYKVLSGKELDKNLAYKLSELKNDDIIDLISLSNKVKNKFDNQKHICTIMNIKSGRCSQDCKFCAQSSFYKTSSEIYDLKDKEEILKQAKYCADSGVKNFGLVTAGKGFNKIDDDFEKILESIKAIEENVKNLSICASFGILTKETVRKLADKNIKNYNINLQTSSKKYPHLVSKRLTIEQKKNTIKLLKENNIKICSGGIFGLGETIKDRIDFAYELKELDVDVIPLNILIPIKGTPAENNSPLTAMDIAKSFAIFRLINPTKTIKFAAGRETSLKDFMALFMLSGINGFLTGGYLTTRGRKVSEDINFLKELELF